MYLYVTNYDIMLSMHDAVLALSDVSSQSRYLGMWSDDHYHGPGILINQNTFEAGIYSDGENVVSQNFTIQSNYMPPQA